MYKIYMIVCDKTGEKYVGLTRQATINKRILGHKHDSKHFNNNMKIGESLRMYGWENHSVGLLEETDDPTRENFWIEQFQCTLNENLGFNISPNTRQKLSDSGSFNWVIEFDTGEVIHIRNLKKWCDENGYSKTSMHRVKDGATNKYKNVVRVCHDND